MRAFLITIIVLLILSGVSINAVVGDNGILSNASDAVLKQGIAVLEEFMNLEYASYIDTGSVSTLFAATGEARNST